MTKNAAALGLAALFIGGVGYAKSKAKAAPATPVASAELAAKSGSKLSGKATFTPDAKGMKLVVEVSGAPPGLHAVHIHDKGDCSAADGSSAGGHWNPTNEPHGAWIADHHHLGDVGNLEVNAEGKGTITLVTDKWTSGGPSDPVGHSIIVHGGVDDFKTQPTGNAGNRLGCGVIVAVTEAKK